MRHRALFGPQIVDRQNAIELIDGQRRAGARLGDDAVYKLTTLIELLRIAQIMWDGGEAFLFETIDILRRRQQETVSRQDLAAIGVGGASGDRITTSTDGTAGMMQIADKLCSF